MSETALRQAPRPAENRRQVKRNLSEKFTEEDVDETTQQTDVYDGRSRKSHTAFHRSALQKNR